MKEDFVKEGMWSLDQSFENYFSGKLEYTKNGILQLEIRGVFDIYKISKLLDVTIYGKTDQLNKNVTLKGCMPIHWTNVSIVFKINQCFLGDHIENTTDLLIQKVHVEYFGLQDYLKGSGFVYDGFSGVDFSISYSKLDPLKLSTSQFDIEIWRCMSQTMSNEKNGEKKFSLREYCVTLFEYAELVNLNQGIENLSYFAYLVSILSNNTIFPNKISLTLDNKKKVEYIYSNPYLRNTYNNVDDNIIDYDPDLLQNLIPKWFEKKEDFQTFSHYKRESDLHHTAFNESRFLDSLTVLETFHKRFKNNDVDKQIQLTIDKIFTANIIPEKQKVFFENSFKNGKSNLQRYRELYYFLPSKLQSSICDNMHDYCYRLKETRNAFTHNDRKKEKLLRNEKMSNATLNNEMLIKLLILHQLGYLDHVKINNCVDFFEKLYFDEEASTVIKKSNKQMTL